MEKTIKARCDWCHEYGNFRKPGPRICKKCWKNRGDEAYIDSLPSDYPPSYGTPPVSTKNISANAKRGHKDVWRNLPEAKKKEILAKLKKGREEKKLRDRIKII